MHFFLTFALPAPSSLRHFLNFPVTCFPIPLCPDDSQVTLPQLFTISILISHYDGILRFQFHDYDTLLFQSSSATGAHSAAYSWHFAHKCSTLSGDCKSVDLAPVSFTIRSSISGFSSIGHGRRWFSLNGWFSLYAINSGCFKISSRVWVLIFAPE